MAGKWLPVANLTSSKRPILTGDEVECFYLSSIDIEPDFTTHPTLSPYTSGILRFLTLTTHRLIWISPSSDTASISLSHITHIYPPKKSLKSMLSISSPRVKFDYSHPSMGSIAVTLVMRGKSDNHELFYEKFWAAWKGRAWESSGAVAALRYAPQHNWIAYEAILKTNPVLAKMVISGVVYSIGDWIAQCYEGKPLFDFDRARMVRSGLVGFAFHGSLSHYYYEICEAVFPVRDWWAIPVKAAFDQTVWTGIWNTIYLVSLGLMRLESPANIYKELKATFWPLLTTGWKLWPFAHIVTYGVIPVEQRLLWVDCVELIWVTILSTYINDSKEARIAEESVEATISSPSEE